MNVNRRICVDGPRLMPVTACNSAFGVWDEDWVASPPDDLVLIPRNETNVYQKVFAKLEQKLKAKKKA